MMSHGTPVGKHWNKVTKHIVWGIHRRKYIIEFLYILMFWNFLVSRCASALWSSKNPCSGFYQLPVFLCSLWNANKNIFVNTCAGGVQTCASREHHKRRIKAVHLCKAGIYCFLMGYECTTQTDSNVMVNVVKWNVVKCEGEKKSYRFYT